MYEDHLKTCEYCQNSNRNSNRNKNKVSKPTIFIKSASSYSKHEKPIVRIKAASSYQRERKLSELASIIKGTKAASSVTITQSYLSDQVRKAKLRELGRMVKG